MNIKIQELLYSLLKTFTKFSKFYFFITGLVIILSLIGISRLEVENSFINYFNKDTEIYKGMKLN